jgi:hypothetical protein
MMKKAQLYRRGSWRAALGAALVLTALAPAALAAPARHAPNASASGTVLSLSDVTSAYGSGFKQTLGKAIKSSELDKSITLPGGKSARPKITDFVTGYQNAYTRRLMSIKKGKVTFKPGVSQVDSAVYVFKSSSSPNALLQYLQQSFKKQKLPKGLAFKITAVKLVGDGGLLEITSEKASSVLPTGVAGIGLFFRHGQFLAGVTVTSYGRGASLSSLVSLAKKVDSHL